MTNTLLFFGGLFMALGIVIFAHGVEQVLKKRNEYHQRRKH